MGWKPLSAVKILEKALCFVDVFLVIRHLFKLTKKKYGIRSCLYEVGLAKVGHPILPGQTFWAFTWNGMSSIGRMRPFLCLYEAGSYFFYVYVRQVHNSFIFIWVLYHVIAGTDCFVLFTWKIIILPYWDPSIWLGRPALQMWCFAKGFSNVVFNMLSFHCFKLFFSYFIIFKTSIPQLRSVIFSMVAGWRPTTPL